jgi:hypothetical protein
MTFDAIINGAGGVIYWGAPFLPKEDPAWSSLKSVAAELHQLLPILTADSEPADHIVKSSNPAIEAAVRHSPSQTCVLLANTRSAREETSLSFHGIKVKALAPRGKTVIEVPAASPYQLRFRPLEVAVFLIEK